MVTLFDQNRAVELFGMENKNEGRREMILGMADEGISTDVIARIANISVSEVDEIVAFRGELGTNDPSESAVTEF